MSYTTNWNDLPRKLKCRCIGNMDFKTRFCLRGTSKTEKFMVDLFQCHFESVTVSSKNGNPCSSVVLVQNKNTKFTIQSRQIYYKQETILPLLNYILENGNIEKFIILKSSYYILHKNGPTEEDKAIFRWDVMEFLNSLDVSLKIMEDNARPKTNWRNLPTELKEECIKKMKFMERWNLRQTARLELYLVRSIGFELKNVTVRDEIISVKLHPESNENLVLTVQESIQFFASVLKKAVVASFLIKTGNEAFTRALFEEGGCDKLIEATQVSIDCRNWRMIRTWLQIFKRVVDIDCISRDPSTCWKLRSISGNHWSDISNIFRFQNIIATNTSDKVIEEWIKSCPEIGTIFDFETITYEPMFDLRSFSRHSFQILKGSDHCKIRIKTKNEGRDVLLYQRNDAYRFSCRVISVDSIQ